MNKDIKELLQLNKDINKFNSLPNFLKNFIIKGKL